MAHAEHPSLKLATEFTVLTMDWLSLRALAVDNLALIEDPIDINAAVAPNTESIAEAVNGCSFRIDKAYRVTPAPNAKTIGTVISFAILNLLKERATPFLELKILMFG